MKQLLLVALSLVSILGKSQKVSIDSLRELQHTYSSLAFLYGTLLDVKYNTDVFDLYAKKSNNPNVTLLFNKLIYYNNLSLELGKSIDIIYPPKKEEEWVLKPADVYNRINEEIVKIPKNLRYPEKINYTILHISDSELKKLRYPVEEMYFFYHDLIRLKDPNLHPRMKAFYCKTSDPQILEWKKMYDHYSTLSEYIWKMYNKKFPPKPYKKPSAQMVDSLIRINLNKIPKNKIYKQ